MKKLLLVLLISSSLMVLSGCQDPVIEETPIIETVKANLEIDSELEDITLPTEIDGVTISWQSSKPNLVTSAGVIIKPEVDVSTSLTATLSFEDRVMTKVFSVIVLGEVSVDYNKVLTALNSISFDEYEVIDDIALIDSVDGITVTWSSNDDEVISLTGVVTRPLADVGDAEVTMTASLSYNEIIVTKDFIFTVIDLTHSVVYLGYYAGAGDLEGDVLKAFLHDLIDEHTVISYSALWAALAVSDRDPENANNIILFYTGVSISKEEHGGDVGEWNREHIWARSHGDLDEFIADSDMHHIRPTDVMMNSKRGSLDFDLGGSIVYDDTIATDNYKDSDSWEPRDEVKGDVARMLFYMAVRYEGDDGYTDLELNDSVNNINSPFIGKLSILIEWHLNDLPDEFELNRNDVIFGYQGNRNPFIDHPEFVELIWGTS